MSEQAMHITDEELIARVRSIQVASVRGRHSPHKPLLLLLAIGRHLNGEDRLVSFKEIEDRLKGLISQFGLPDSRDNAHYPFWRLRNDDRLWEIDRPELVRMTSARQAYVSDLREHGVRGGLTQDVLNRLEASPDVTRRIVGILLDDYFPPSLHDDVMIEVGLDGIFDWSEPSVEVSRRLKRDRSFRDIVLRAYEYRCAVCRFDIRLFNRSIGLEAAHIKWHKARGPASVRNGVALCVLHHKLFDTGLFTVLEDLTVLVAEQATGDSFQESLNRHNRHILQVIPSCADKRPKPKYLDWHKTTVFKTVDNGRK